MTPEQIILVQSSFAKIAPIADLAASLFYDRLFEIDPTLRHMFPEDLSDQKRKLMHMLQIAVNGLNRLTNLIPALEELGRRHGGYGVTDEHYATVGAALLWTLERGLGEDWTPEAANAWATTYTVLSTVMKDAVELKPSVRFAA